MGIGHLKVFHQQYLTMDADGKAYVYVTKCEIGQHVGTALAQAVAEELEINWDDVNVIYPDSHAKWGLMITGGSWSVNWTFDRNSRIGASARIALIEAGSKMMNAKTMPNMQFSSTVGEQTRTKKRMQTQKCSQSQTQIITHGQP